jgi:lysophospholipase L1-like esterase
MSDIIPNALTAPIRLEAEKMTLGGTYRIENQTFASGGSFIGLNGSTGTASSLFTGTTGFYDVVVGYYDESDGAAQLSVNIGGTLVDSWTLNNSPGGTRAQASNFQLRTITSNLLITNNTLIELTGLLDAGEPARVDYIEFRPVSTGATNTPPQAVADNLSTPANTALAIAATTLLSNDSDSNGDPLVVTAVGNPSSGSLVAGSGSYLYTPNTGFTGTDSFTYTISDGKGGTATATVSVAVLPSTTGSLLRLEAEKMTLGGTYRIENQTFASGGSFIGLNGSTGTASSLFTGTTGFYDVVVGYYDESDGAAQLSVNIGGTLVDSWTLNNSPGGTRAQASNFQLRTIAPNLLITNNTLIELTGLLDAGEPARVDYIEFKPVTSTPVGEGTADYSSAQNGVILNLTTQVGLSPVFGSLSNPRFMPLGDSITAGQHRRGAVPGSYRIQFWERAVTDDLNINFVGTQNNSSGGLGDGDHEGHPGWTINQLRLGNSSTPSAGKVADWLSAHPTDAVMLMIGTNDANSGASATTMRDHLSLLIDEITTQAPNTYLFVSSIPPLDAPNGTPTAAQKVIDFNALIPALVQQKVQQGKKVFYRDAGGRLTVQDMNGDNSATSDLDDGIHPTAAGYDKLGNYWYEAVFNPESLGNKQNLIGSQYADKLIGNTNSNSLTGGSGDDLLTGSGGADTYIYISPNEGFDTITDFSSDDLIQVAAAGFLGGLTAGFNLSQNGSNGSFVKGDNPSVANNQAAFLYNTSTGILSFDRDGQGAVAAIDLLRLQNASDLIASQIEIV